MTEYDLKSLNELPVPPPRAEARAAALQASLDVFIEEGAGAAQGSSSSVRRRGASSHERSISMKRSFPKFAIAASLAVLAIGVPTTIHYYMQTHGPAPGQSQQTGPVPPAPVLPRVTSQASPGDLMGGVAGDVKVLAAPPRRESAAVMADRAGGARVGASQLAVSSARPGMVHEQHVQESGVLMPVTKADEGRDRFQQVASNPVKSVRSEPVSTFSIDVDTGAYSFVRRSLMAGHLPPKDAVRVEEMINYFPYDYARPQDRTAPFAPTVTVMPAPWNPANRLMHVAIKGYDVATAERPRANLVFLIDTSGSMAGEDRLPLLKNSLRPLVDTLKPDDTIGIVTYAGAARAVLEPTKVAEKAKIFAAIDQLQAGGGTAGGAGLQEAYRMAESAFDKAAVNRIILGTDGDFNVGIADREQLKGFIERKRQSGIYLSILGFGRGNYNDALMQALVQNGNGTAAYIDTLNEARKVLADEASSMLFPIAKDVKVQVEFNPTTVAEYRLIGYETRALRREDFNNDKVDAGEIGSGHAVTAIYELTPVAASAASDPLRYQQPKAEARPAASQNDQELTFLKIRYKLPDEETSRLIELPVRVADAVSVEQASADVRFSTAVAAFGQLLRGEPHLGSFGYDDVIALANAAKGDDPFGYRAEFVNLVRLTKSARP